MKLKEYMRTRPGAASAALICLVTLLVFGRLPGYEFLNWDDNMHVTENPSLNPVTWSSFEQFWTKKYAIVNVPATYSVWSLAAWLSQVQAEDGRTLNPVYFHAANILFHLISCLCLLGIINRVLRNLWAACAGALLYAIHPIQVEAVAWISGLRDVMAGSFTFLSIWLYLIFADRVETWAQTKLPQQENPLEPQGWFHKMRPLVYPLLFLILSAISFALAIMSKPNAVVAPAMMWILLKLQKLLATEEPISFSQWIKPSLKEAPILLLLGAALPAMIMIKNTQPNQLMDFVTPTWARPLIATDTLSFYLYKLILPVSFGPDYGRTPKWVIENKVLYWTWILPAAVVILSLFSKCRWKYLLIFLLLISGTAPMLGTIPFAFQDISTVTDRYCYIGMAGPALIFGLLAARLLRRSSFVYGMSVVLLVLSIRSFFQTYHWTDSETFWRHSLTINPNSPNSHSNLGIMLMRKDRIEEAMEHITRTLEISPGHPAAHNNAGLYWKDKGDLQKAEHHFSEAIRSKPELADAHNNLGTVFMQQGKLERALEHMNIAVQLKPYSADILFNVGQVFLRMKKFDEAMEFYMRTLEQDSRYFQAEINLGSIYFLRKQPEKALHHYRRSLEIKPDSTTHFNIAIILMEQGDTQEAKAHLKEALGLNPHYTKAMLLLKKIETNSPTVQPR